MKTSPPAAAIALAALYARDPQALEQTFDHMTNRSLERLDGWLQEDYNVPRNDQYFRLVAQAIARRMAHKSLHKYKNISPPEVVEAALKFHRLPKSLQAELGAKYGGDSQPTSWFLALERFKELASGDPSELWKLVMRAQ
mmetsp:Transcript_30076/g.62857  ORF Transcript_30076/g.62857 Transcript_30076/m.62857 type:complete len:140 (-) Transcript_30076:1602-2021(-)